MKEVLVKDFPDQINQGDVFLSPFVKSLTRDQEVVSREHVLLSRNQDRVSCGYKIRKAG